MPAKPKNDAKAGNAKRCPICGKPATDASKPFCSERCRDVDLNRWLSDSYRIPAAQDDGEDAAWARDRLACIDFAGRRLRNRKKHNGLRQSGDHPRCPPTSPVSVVELR